MQHSHIFNPPPTISVNSGFNCSYCRRLKETCYSLSNLTWITGDRGVWGYMLHNKQVIYEYLVFYKKKIWVTSHLMLKFEFVSNPSVFGSFYHCKKMFSYTQTYNNNVKYRVKMSSIIFVKKKNKMLS